MNTIQLSPLQIHELNNVLLSAFERQTMMGVLQALGVTYAHLASVVVDDEAAFAAIITTASDEGWAHILLAEAVEASPLREDLQHLYQAVWESTAQEIRRMYTGGSNTARAARAVYVQTQREAAREAQFHAPPQYVNRSASSSPAQGGELPFMVPALPPQGVFGRTQLITNLAQRLHLFDSSVENTPAVALRGMGGIGKTTLAAAIGRLKPVQRTFPDGVLWVSLGQRPTVRLVQNNWGRALQLDLMAERDEAACRDRLREALHRRRCLLLIDDVWEVEHGRQFRVAGPLCRTIYTTRESVIAHELVTRTNTIRVELLEPEAAVALLQQLAPEAVTADEQSAYTLCERLEYLPLAITLAGRMLANEADVPSRMRRLQQELIERRDEALKLVAQSGRLGDSEERPLSVRQILDLSVSRLNQTDRERFAMSSVFGGDPLTWELEAAAFVWECSIEQAEDTTARLIQRGLVERRNGQYWMHALLADYSAELMVEMGL